MVVDDLVVCGAEPLFMTDYIASGKVVPERIAAIVSGIAEGCRQAGCALVGGETAEHPGLLAPDEYDVAGAGTGVVEADDLLGPDRVRAGDVVDRDARQRPALQRLLARAPRAAHDRRPAASTAHVDELGRTLGEELLEPTRIYAARLPRPRARRRRRRARHSATSPAAGSRPTSRACCRRRARA